MSYYVCFLVGCMGWQHGQVGVTAERVHRRFEKTFVSIIYVWKWMWHRGSQQIIIWMLKW